MNILTPLRFHRVHGQSIKLSNDFCTAQIATPKEKPFLLTHECLAFSSRPVAVNEKIYLRLESDPRSFLDLVHFGFTDCDPNTITDLKSCELINWLKHFWRRLNDKDNILDFCVKPSGEVYCFMNDKDMSFLIRKININVPHWAVIILTHNITIVKFIDCPKENETEELIPPSIEKPLPPTTNALDEPRKQFGNISSLKLNSKMDIEEPETAKALQLETKEEEDCATSPTDFAMNILTPLRFHRVHGQSIKISNDYCTAQIATPKEKPFFLIHECLAFSSRPVAVNEKVYLRLGLSPSAFHDFSSFAFTDCDPNIISDLESWRRVRCSEYFWQNLNDKDNIIYFCVKPSGEVNCFMNNKDMSILIKKININVPHWVVIRLSHKVTTVKFIDSPKENETEDLKRPSIKKPLPPTANALYDLDEKTIHLILSEVTLKLTAVKEKTSIRRQEDEPKKQFGNISNLKLNSTMDIEEPETSKALQLETNIGNTILEEEDCATSHADVAMNALTPLRFHRVHGQFITISNDYCTARIAIPKEKDFLQDHECLAFSSRPVPINEKVYLRLELGPSTYRDFSGFSITDYDPNTIADLTSWPWGEPMMYFKHSLNDKYNIFHFCVKPSGEVCYFMNDEHIFCSENKININVPHWAVIKLNHKVTTVKFIDSPKENETVELIAPSIEKPLPPTTNALNEPKRQFGNINNLNLNLTTDRENSVSPKAFKPLEKEDYATSHADVAMNALTPLRFHRVHGQFITISNDYCTARIAIPKEKYFLQDHECLAFSSRPVPINKKVYLRLELGPSTYWDFSGFSITDHDPNTIADLTSWPWGEPRMYFGFSLNDKYNIFHFCVKPSGEVCCFINDKYIFCSENKININVPHWAVIRLNHKVTIVKFIDSPKETETEELKPPSIEKPLPPTTNALNEPKRQFGNINNLKLNLTTDRENSVSPKAFKPLEEEDCATSPTDFAMNILTPLRFHKVHGQSIKISNDYCTAQIATPKEKPFFLIHECLAFSSRPVAVNEKVYLRLGLSPSAFHDFSSFAFTDCNPNIISDLESWRRVRCSEYFWQNLNDKDNIIYFCVKPSGEVNCFMNNKDMSILIKKININVPHWVVIRLSQKVTTVKFIDSPKENETEDLKRPSIKKPLPPTANTLDEPKKQFGNISNLKLNSTMDIEEPETSKALQLKTNIGNTILEEEDCATSHADVAMNAITPLRFHRVHGQFIKISNDYCTARIAIPKEKDFLQFHECLAFSSRPVAINEKVYLRLELGPSTYDDFSGFSIIDYDPNTIADLTSCLWGESKIYFKNSLNDKYNIFHFCVKPSGKVCCFMNDKDISFLIRKININVPHWAVIKLNHKVTTVKFINSPKENETEELIPPSIEKPLPPTTNALNEPKRQFGNINNVKLNLTTDRENSVSPKAFKPLEEEDCATSYADVAINVLNPLRFHKVHGQSITISNDYCTAQITIPKEKRYLPSYECLAFSSRPVAINEKDEPKRQFGNINNLNLNLTTDRENSASPKAFKPLEEEAPRTSYTGGTPNNLPPLSFHFVHGKNVRISTDGSMARRVELWQGITFSARPVRVNEKVCIRFVEISNRWSGVIKFGFTSHDPAALAHSLPNNVYLDYTHKPGNWTKSLDKRFCEKDNIMYYYVNSSGDVHFGVNGEDKGLFFSGVGTRSPLWALIDVYGNCTAVQIADPRAPSQIKRHSPMEEETLVRSIRSLTVEELLPPLRYQNPLIPLSLHRTKGRNVQFINDKGVAARADAEFREGYVFTARPMRPGQTIVVQILATESTYVGSLAIGLTSCDPATLRPCDLPDDAELLLDRPEYWVVRKNAANALRRGDELAVTLTLDGEVSVSRNGCTAVTVMHVDHTVRLWAFVDIYGATQKVRMLSTQVPQPAQTPPQQLRVLTDSAALINGGDGGTVQLPDGHSEPPRFIERLPSGPSTSHLQPIYSVIGEENLTGTECTICYENPIDSVLYMCGHMCMCYRCAVQQWKGKGSGQCPLCRQQIKDVIRPYKS